MDKSLKIKQYEQLILNYLAENVLHTSESEGYERVVVSDKENHHYQLLATGWATPTRFINAIAIHLQIKSNGKIWLLENNTELHPAEDLVQLGVSKEDIVLGFHPPQLRTYSGYAMA
jgi:XisI protein